MNLFAETLVGGLLAGVMYSLVAIGFVLIYKASGIFNFAQGAMVLFAALTFVTLRDIGWSCPLALSSTLIVMVVGAIFIERFVLRPLIGQSDLTLFMATLGLSYIIEGLAQLLMGASVHELDLGVEDLPIQIGPILVSKFDLLAATIAGLLVLCLSLFFNLTRTGISLRAIADDTVAAQSIGIKLPVLWRVVWGVAGLVALVAGLLWGARQGVQFSLTLVVLKALPVLIIGGFTSIGGAIVGGLLIGATESLAEIYVSDLLGGSVSTWVAYLVALIFLLVRPSGLFGEHKIERV